MKEILQDLLTGLAAIILTVIAVYGIWAIAQTEVGLVVLIIVAVLGVALIVGRVLRY